MRIAQVERSYRYRKAQLRVRSATRACAAAGASVRTYRSPEPCERCATRGGEQNDQPRRDRPHRKQCECCKREREVIGSQDGAGPGRLIQHRQEQANDGGIDPTQGCLDFGHERNTPQDGNVPISIRNEGT
jgi:hypothetical protein